MDMSPADRCRHIREKLKEDGVYNQWLVSPAPYLIRLDEYRFLELLGPALYSFYKASNKIYYESIHGRMPEWIARYLNQGKPQSLIEYASMNRMKGLLPGVIRPDIILTENGMIASELDSVPGGIGITGSLNRAYGDYGYSVAGETLEKDNMLKGFMNMVSGVAHLHDPVIAIIVSDESRDYRAEMEWLAGAIRESGGRAYTIRPQDVIFNEEGLYFDGPNGGTAGFGRLKIDVVYRFYELFDMQNIPKSELIMYSARKKDVAVTPPFKTFIEEKMLYAIFHHPLLETYWVNELGKDVFAMLSKLFPRTWILDPAEMPPYGIIPGLRIGNRNVVSKWADLADSTQKERRFVIKPSGFSELAWGSRGVTVGEDVSKDDWGAVIEGALNSFDRTPYILQEFHKGRHVQIDYLADNPGKLSDTELNSISAGVVKADITTMTGRVRLCPYYFVEGEAVRLRGIMATVCPLDKKLIHGMKDAVITSVGISGKE
ncbi:MAG: hypothetical protein IT392_04400 [Nitrospirae bacterium]|nr:hypothetical protein [Nitrospirota bacterium]